MKPKPKPNPKNTKPHKNTDADTRNEKTDTLALPLPRPVPLTLTIEKPARVQISMRGFRGVWVADVASHKKFESREHDIVATCPQQSFSHALASAGPRVVLACANCRAILECVGGVVMFEAALAEPLVAWCNVCARADT